MAFRQNHFIMWRDAKYLIAYIAPVSAYLALMTQGIWSYLAVYVAFILIPIFDQVVPLSKLNFSAAKEETRKLDRFFDWLLYANLPILYGLILFYFHVLTTQALETYELVGLTLSVGVVIGSSGINVGHELGHRANKTEQWIAKALLLPGLYLHFFIEHNRGHHKNVATDADPASARYGEILYLFWLRSVFGGYISAWKLEAKRLQRLGKPAWHWQNEMWLFLLIKLIYLGVITWFWGFAMLPFAIAVAAVGFLLLESVNYIEHYGLRREEIGEGRYEKVGPQHSWNSNHEVGRIFLYELTRHSDHHYKASRKYQILRHFDESPQLPLGYPASILLSLVPPLWFWVMNKRVQKVKQVIN